jgi:hypothetical protein
MRFVNKASLIFQFAQTVDYVRKWNLFAAVAGVEFIHHELHSVAVLFSFFALFSVVVGIWSDGLYCRKYFQAQVLSNSLVSIISGALWNIAGDELRSVILFASPATNAMVAPVFLGVLGVFVFQQVPLPLLVVCAGPQILLSFQDTRTVEQIDFGFLSYVIGGAVATSMSAVFVRTLRSPVLVAPGSTRASPASKGFAFPWALTRRLWEATAQSFDSQDSSVAPEYMRSDFSSSTSGASDLTMSDASTVCMKFGGPINMSE